jgi:flagellar basal body-associated protein FliL
MATPAVKIKKTEPNRKKLIIIISVIAVVCLSAAGGLYVVFSSGSNEPDEFGRRRPRFNDANMPDPHKQSAEEIMKYRNSEKFKKLSPQEQMMYTGASMRTMMNHHTETFFNLPEDKKTAYLDKLIDEMQQNMKNFEQMRNQMPRRPREPNDINDPNAQRRRAERIAQRNNPANVRSMRERGDPEERAKQTQFRQAMQKRMQQRGIQMPRMGGGPGGGGPGGR